MYEEPAIQYMSSMLEPSVNAAQCQTQQKAFLETGHSPSYRVWDIRRHGRQCSHVTDDVSRVLQGDRKPEVSTSETGCRRLHVWSLLCMMNMMMAPDRDH